MRFALPPVLSRSIAPLLAGAVTAALAAQQAPQNPGQSGGGGAPPSAEKPWPGFVTGLRGFEHLHDPIGQPIYFETAANDTGLRALFLHHEFSKGSPLQGGTATIYAVQARLALTERLGLIATKDGYSDFDSNLLPEHHGWNSLAGGLKYVALADKDHDLLITPGCRLEVENGTRNILQGGVAELSPFVSVAKGFDRFHTAGNLTWRIPLDTEQGNHIFQWDLHGDYDVAPDALPGFAPTVEVHGLHYLSNGKALPLNIGGLDYSNLGSSNVAGSFVAWAGIGARQELMHHRLSIGAVYEFALTNPDNDLMDKRVTIDFVLRF